MRACSIAIVLCLFATWGVAQTVAFDCQAVGAFPAIGGAGDCEGVTGTATTSVQTNGACGFPSSGTQFARLIANGPINGGIGHPAGTPIARPCPAIIAEVRVPAPVGATSVALCFNFHRAEGANQATFNDGMEIAIVDSLGAMLAPVAYADTYTALAPSGCVDPLNSAPEAGVTWPDNSVVFFPALPVGAYMSIACWNSGDNAVASSAVVDTIIWNGLFPICAVPPPPPSNDDCGGAIPVGTGTNPAPAASGNTFNNVAATLSAGWAVNCSGVNIAKDVWFSFTPFTSGIYQIDTETPAGFSNGSIADTVLEVYNTNCVVGPAIACDDDAGITNTGLLSICFANLTAGSTYHIRVGAYASAAITEGTFYLTVTFVGPPLPNDECSGATPLVLGVNPSPGASGVTFSNIGSTTSAGYPAACAAILNDLWFSFTPAVSDTYVFTTNTPCGFTAGTMTNTTIALYDAAACAAPAAAIACDADTGVGSLSTLSAALTAGSTYFLRVGPTTNVFQTFYVTVRQGGLAQNNECATSLTVGVGTNPAPAASCNQYNNEGATTSVGWPAICATIVNDVWFNFTPIASGSYIIDTNNPCGFANGTATNTTMAIYPSCTPGAPLACDADSGTGSLSLINIALTAGTTYYVRVGTTATTGTGTFYLNINPGTTAVPNDTCATAIPVGLGINPAPGASCVTYANDFATSDTLGYPPVCATIVNDVWFTFTAPINADYRFSTETPPGFATGTNTNSTVAVYAPGCLLGAPIACDADSGVTGTGLMSIVNANGLIGGTTYYVRVGSTSATVAGTFYLTISPIFSLAFSSPFGPGSLQADIISGPPFGVYFMCVTLNAGLFPNGFFFGIDPSLQEIADQVNLGFPFIGPLNAFGAFTIGPVAGLPSGLPLYAVALGFNGPLGPPNAVSAPRNYVIP